MTSLSKYESELRYCNNFHFPQHNPLNNKGKEDIPSAIKVIMTSNARAYRATVIVIILWNILYAIMMMKFHISGYPNVLNCYLNSGYHSCLIPSTVTSYKYVIGILISKSVVLPVALVTEFVVAIQITTAVHSQHLTLTNGAHSL